MATSQDLLKRAEKAAADKQWIDAATLYERAGDVDKAIAAYQKGGGVDRAAMLLESSGRAAQAAALLSSVGQHLKAAALYEKIKDHRKAAAAYLRANQRERAAGMYEKAEAFEDAAKIYQSLGNFNRAVQLYEAAGNEAKAGELRAQASAEQKAAEQVLELDPGMDVAASEYVESGALVDRVVALLRKGRAQDAAKLYGNCQEDVGYNVIAAVAGDRPTEMKCAEMFYLSRDFVKSAQVLESIEDWGRSGLMYEKADDFYMAGEMYVRASNKAKAAEMFEKHGNYQQAAQFYLDVKQFDKAAVNFEKSVNNFVAGKLYFRMQKMNKSLQLLQKVQRNESEYFEACRLIGEILAANGHLDLAIRKYLEVVQSAELSDKTAPVFMNLGKALEQRGNLKQALSAYEKIAGWNFGFEDVAQRIEKLKSATAAAAAPEPAEEIAVEVDSADVVEGEEAAPAPQKQIVSMMDGFDFLKGTPLFQDLSLDEMKAVYHACEQKQFAPGEVIIEQNQAGNGLYVLRKGSAVVVKVDEKGDEETVAKLGAGAPLGEMSLVTDMPTSARVMADSVVEAFYVSSPEFDKLLGLNERIALKLYRFFVQTLAKRLRDTSEGLARASQR